MKTISRLKTMCIAVAAALALGIALYYFITKADITICLLIFSALGICLLLAFSSIETFVKENGELIRKSVDNSITEALEEGEIGILVYSENYKVVWVSDYLKNKKMDRTGDRLLIWLPELQDLIQGNSDAQVVVINDEKYEVTRKDGENVLLFKDVTKIYDLRTKGEEDAYVVGMLSYDNFDELSEDEDDVSFVNANIKTPVNDYFRSYGVMTKTLRNNRLLLILNEKIYKQLLDDRFSILSLVRKEAKKAGLDVTLSISFARGSESYSELDEMAQELIELAQTRGGDQVVVRKIGEEALFFGGSSEAREKQSKVKVRVLSNTLRGLIQSSSNVVIACHTTADSDCIGSAFCMAKIAKNLGKESFVITKSGGIEPMIADVMKQYDEELSANYNMISETDAFNHLDDNTLVIMVDHHSSAQSNASNLLKVAKKIVIIDHHRRRADLGIEPTMVYIEASASSTCELASEFIPYLLKKDRITACEANMMYLGIIIDTNRFRNRTGVRTFDACKRLREYGADPVLCEKLSQEPYEMVMKRTKILSEAEIFSEGIVIASMKEGIYPRSIASQASDSLMSVKDVDAAFVVCEMAPGEIMVSARSKGNVNVQVIMEKMNGGGHMTSAGLQRNNTSVEAVTNELKGVLELYIKENSQIV